MKRQNAEHNHTEGASHFLSWLYEDPNIKSLEMPIISLLLCPTIPTGVFFVSLISTTTKTQQIKTHASCKIKKKHIKKEEEERLRYKGLLPAQFNQSPRLN